MDVNYITNLAYEFREALNSVVNDRKYGRLRIFRHFPHGCCRYASDLLAEYLVEYGISQERIKMVEAETNKGAYTHCWLMVDDDLYIDITADQFIGKSFFRKYEPIPCYYVAQCDKADLYKCFDISKMQFLQNIGIDSYSGDIQVKLRIVYTAALQHINYKARRR